MEDTQGSDSFDIFVSHSHKDYQKVNLYLEYLKDKKTGLGEIFPVFIAHKDITPTKPWEEEIIKALKHTKIFIAYLTPNFKKSEWCGQESGIAYANDQFIIPLMDGSKPYGFLGKYQGMPIPSNPRHSRSETPTITGLKEFAVSIIKSAYDDKRCSSMVRNKILGYLNDISSFSQTDLVFSLLEHFKPFTEEEKTTILKAYEGNKQINQAGSADSLIMELKQNE